MNIKIKIEISDQEVQTREITSKKDGKKYTFYTQKGWLHNGVSQYPTAVNIPLDRDGAPYNPGFYSLSPESLYSDRFNNLIIARNYRLVSAD